MRFQTKTEEQLKAERLMPDGIYPFHVINAENKKSKAGNDMIALEILIFLPDGRQWEFTDYLMEKVAFKLFHFCKETGLGGAYNQGTLDAQDCVSKTGYVKIGSKIRKDTGDPQNTVKDYVPNPGAASTPISSRPQPTEDQLANKTDTLDDSDVPF